MSGALGCLARADCNFLAALGLIGQTKVAANKKGELELPFPGPNGKPRHWVEVAPFVWQDVDGHDRAAAKVVDGAPVRFSFDFLSPFMVFERAPWYSSSIWLTPVFGASFAAMLLTVLIWPAAAIVRRRYHAPLALDPLARRAYRASRIGAAAILAALGVWGLFVIADPQGHGHARRATRSAADLAQLLSIVAFIGGLAAMLWNLPPCGAGRAAGRRRSGASCWRCRRCSCLGGAGLQAHRRRDRLLMGRASTHGRGRKARLLGPVPHLRPRVRAPGCGRRHARGRHASRPRRGLRRLLSGRQRAAECSRRSRRSAPRSSRHRSRGAAAADAAGRRAQRARLRAVGARGAAPGTAGVDARGPDDPPKPSSRRSRSAPTTRGDGGGRAQLRGGAGAEAEAHGRP